MSDEGKKPKGWPDAIASVFEHIGCATIICWIAFLIFKACTR